MTLHEDEQNRKMTVEPCLRGFRTRSETNRAVQSLNMARGLKFRIQEVEGLYYLCSENKGTDQLWRDDREIKCSRYQ